MEARKSTLRDLLAGNDQFIIPIYQRTYGWDKEHCKQLYDDIVQVGLSGRDSTHFMGAITYHTPKQTIANINHHQLIDGQQRITTFMLLLAALKRKLGDQIPQPKLIDQILYNIVESEDSDGYLKIKLTQDDNDTFEEILKNGHTSRVSNIRTNYEFFCKWVSQDNFDVIWKGIQKLTVVHIATNDQDNAQRIFESMNSTGLDLSTTDLVQNYLLMQKNPDKQKKAYNDHWHPIEKIFVDERKRNGFDGYLHCYLTMKQRLSITKKELYKKFKEYAKQHADDILPDLHQHAKHYACLLYPDDYKSSSEKLDRMIKHISGQNADVARPLLLKILYDYESKLISEDDAIELFTFIDSYLLRCAVVGTTRNLNQAIPVIMSKLDENNYANSVKNAVLKRRGRDRFPADPSFIRNFIDKEFYQKDRISRYILERLTEKYQGSTVLNLPKLEIEHIMPRTLSLEWKEALGEGHEEIHNLRLRQIGNLTLITKKENQALGNISFSEKQKIYAKSEVKMTAFLHTNYNQWTEREIISRSEHLADDAIKVWKCPEGHPRSGSENEELEQNHLYGKNVDLLWFDLKNKISAQFPDAIFEMWRKYANFKMLNSSSNSHQLICSIRALQSKIYVIYNTRLSDGIIEVSDFVNDISNVRHLGTGDLRSTIHKDSDIPKAINLIKQIVQKKLVR